MEKQLDASLFERIKKIYREQSVGRPASQPASQPSWRPAYGKYENGERKRCRSDVGGSRAKRWRRVKRVGSGVTLGCTPDTIVACSRPRDQDRCATERKFIPSRSRPRFRNGNYSDSSDGERVNAELPPPSPPPISILLLSLLFILILILRPFLFFRSDVSRTMNFVDV